MTRHISLRNRQGGIALALVDDEDYDGLVEVGAWCLSHGYPVHRRYLGRRNGQSHGVFVKMSRVVLGLEEGDPRMVDHINRDKLDNRKANLRIVTNAQNLQNLAQVTNRGTSRYRGVAWDKSREKWVAGVKVNYVRHNLGRFDTEEEAFEAVRAWREGHLPFSSEDRVDA